MQLNYKSGSVLQPLLLKAMLEKDYTVIVITVGDSSNLLSLNNTINTLASLQGVARVSKKAISTIYYNNTFNDVTSPKTEMDVNNKIFKMLSIFSIFTSGSVQNMDNQDMINFVEPSRYSSFEVKHGLYSLGISLNELTDENTILARTLVDDETEDMNITITPKHNKTGKITVPYEQFDTYPMFLMLRKDVLNTEVTYLKEKHAKIESMSRGKYNAFEALDDSDIDEDSGMVF